MGRNLSNLFISSSYQFLTQISGSELQTGLGDKITGSLEITSSKADIATSASFASTSVSSSYSTNALSSSYSATALSSSHAINANSALTATSASFATNATSASYATNALSSSFAITASFALNAGVTVSTASLLTTASAVANVITFTKGDASTFNVTVATGSAVTTNTGSLLVTASSTDATITYTKGDGSTFNNVINNVSASISASYATNALSASSALTANTATSASFATTAISASQANNANTAISSSFATNAISASFASTATSSSFATSASQAVSASFASNIPNGLSPTFANVTASNVMITGTASVALLYTQTITSSVIYSSGSNQFGDASNDVQTLYGTFNVVNGPSNFTGSVNSLNGFTGSLQGTASFATTATSASIANTATSASFATNALSASYATNALSASTATSASIANTATSASFATNATSASFANNAFSSSYALTASFALNAAGGAQVLTQDLRNNIFLTDTGSFPTQITNASGSIILGNNLKIDGTTAFANVMIGGTANTMSADGGGTLGTGSLMIGGIENQILGGQMNGSFIIGGRQNIYRRPYGFGGLYGGILGGFQNQTIDDGVNEPGGIIIGGRYNGISADASTILGGQNNTMKFGSLYGAIIGGQNNLTNNAGDNSVIVGGNHNLIETGIANSIVLGGSYITASASNTVYTPNLNVSGSLTMNNGFNAISGSNSGSLITNVTDNYTGSAPVKNIVTLTQAEYNAIGSPDVNTLYIISGSVPFNSAAFATTGSNTFIGNQIISGSLTVTGTITGSIASASYATNALSSSYATNALSSSFATFALGAGAANSADSASQAISSSYATNALSASIATTASFYSLAAVTQNAVFSGSVRGDVSALSISSNTASLDLSTGNFFTLTLVSGSNTFVNPTNILPGQTINLRVKQASVASGSISFASSVKQVSGSAYTPTATANGEDIITFISFDSTNLYLSNVKNFV
jgi:hypothetical protein